MQKVSQEKASGVRECEDCSDECETRRTRCPHCKKLVCRWCYHHTHGKAAAIISAMYDSLPIQVGGSE